MKLRIKGNSIRLRLTRGEVEQFGKAGLVEETVEFGPGAPGFVYALQAVPNGPKASAKFRENRLAVLVSRKEADQWVNSDAVGIESDDGVPRILIEKDFACLAPRPGEDESDAFANPAQAAC